MAHRVRFVHVKVGSSPPSSPSSSEITEEKRTFRFSVNKPVRFIYQFSTDAEDEEEEEFHHEITKIQSKSQVWYLTLVDQSNAQTLGRFINLLVRQKYGFNPPPEVSLRILEKKTRSLFFECDLQERDVTPYLIQSNLTVHGETIKRFQGRQKKRERSICIEF